MLKHFTFILYLACSSVVVDAATIRITCRSKGKELDLCKEAIDVWSKNNGHKVEIITLPHSSSECFSLFRQWFGSETFDVDILQMDIAWLGVFADFLSDMKGLIKNLDTSVYFDAIKSNMIKDGKIIALPWYTDCGVIYYRTDLLQKYNKPVPQTWEELYETAQYIQNEEKKTPEKNMKFCGFIFQAKAFEILTCNFLEVLDSFNGEIINKDGHVVVDSDRSFEAVKFLINCMRNISSKGVLNYSEEDARGVFQSGNAVFIRNWPYAYALMNEASTVVHGKIGVMPIPRSASGGKVSGVLGGWFLGVSKYSKHQKIAADLVQYLTNYEQQKKRANYSYAPTFNSLYKDPDVLKANPFFDKLYISLKNAVSRPSIAFGKKYQRASSEIFNSINTILSDAVESNLSDEEIKKRLHKLNKKLTKMLDNNNAKLNDSDVEQHAQKTEKIGFFQKIIEKIAFWRK